TGQQNGLRASRLRRRERPQDAGSPPAGTDSANDVRSGYATFFDRQRASAGLVFRSLNAAIKRAYSPGHDTLHELRRSPKGWRNLAGIQHAQPAARSGADVKEAATFAQRPGHHFNSLRQSSSRFPQSFRDESFF